MSAPPPPYQNQPPQQPYGYPQQPQQPYGQQPYGQQQPYGNPQPPNRPRQPQRSPLRGAITAVIMLGILGGGAWYVWDYNTNPHGGKAAKEAAASASADDYDKKHNPKVGDCVKITGSDRDMEMTIVGCDSTDAQYKTGEVIGGHEKCGPQYSRSIVYSYNHRPTTTWCFSKV
ncbi:hypothetical protein ACIRPT_16140 [Streptomyces sp. NPDC101227]|uniref:LppU/SCO3897 family protein n=1 Tax=Streptomyces sp. NPDC101227 TaxID=3366136 RepID=UPI0037F95884